MFSPDDLLDLIEAALRRREADLRAEHAVHGLDALEEVEFHTLIAEGLRAAGLGVLREQPYPHEWRRKRRGGSKAPPAPAEPAISPALDISAQHDLALADVNVLTGELPDPRDRMRCDLVLTPEPGRTLGDPLVLEKAVRTRRKQAAGTLFEPLAAQEPPPAPAPDTLAPEDAFWLEVKLVGQFCYSAGVPGPNATYAGELVRGPAADARKLSADGRIVHSAVLLLLFTHDRATAEHDVAQAIHRCLDRGIPVASPIRRTIDVTDRIGNCVLSLWLLPVRPG